MIHRLGKSTSWLSALVSAKTVLPTLLLFGGLLVNVSASAGTVAYGVWFAEAKCVAQATPSDPTGCTYSRPALTDTIYIDLQAAPKNGASPTTEWVGRWNKFLSTSPRAYTVEIQEKQSVLDSDHTVLDQTVAGRIMSSSGQLLGQISVQASGLTQATVVGPPTKVGTDTFYPVFSFGLPTPTPAVSGNN